MKARHRLSRWVGLLAAALLVVAAGVAARGQLALWTERRLADHAARQLRTLPEGQAAAFVHQLATFDDNSPEFLALALADPRPSVSDAAEEAIGRVLAEWQWLPREEACSRVAALAHQVAARKDQLPVNRRRFVRQLAGQLLRWPTSENRGRSSMLIADCEALLRMPVSSPEEIQVAARPQERPLRADDTPSTAPIPAAPPQIFTPPAPRFMISDSSEDSITLDTPLPPIPLEPAPLPGASSEQSAEPRRFLAPRVPQLEKSSP